MKKAADGAPKDIALLILFGYSGKKYRMRVAKLHEHPGDADHVEVVSKDMLGGVSWASVPTPWQGSGPSAEWLIRKALWTVTIRDGIPDGPIVVNLGELTRQG